MLCYGPSSSYGPFVADNSKTWYWPARRYTYQGERRTGRSERREGARELNKKALRLLEATIDFFLQCIEYAAR